MNLFVQLGILIVGSILSRALANLVRQYPRPPYPGRFDQPKVAPGTPIPVLYGTRRFKGVTGWFGGAKWVEVKIVVSKYFGFPHSEPIGGQYKATFQQVLCWGKVTSISNMVFGDRQSLADQPVTQQFDMPDALGDHMISILPTFGGEGFVASRVAPGPSLDSIEVYHAGRTISTLFLPNIFGGRGRGGGFTAVDGDANNPYGGRIRFYIGSRQSGPDEVMAAAMGAANTPSYNDLCYVVFDDVNIGESAIPPGIDWIAFRAPSDEMQVSGWGTVVVNARDIPGRVWDWFAQDCSPAAIAYDILRNPLYSLGEPAHRIAGPGVGAGRGISGSFEDANRALVSEGLGMSMIFAGTREAAENALREIERTVDGVLYEDSVTFQRKFKLIRDEATTPDELAALPTFDETKFASLEWHRSDWSETFNVVTVEFSDAERLYEKNTVTLRNDASIAMTKGERPLPNVQYLSITDRLVAEKLCARDLRKVSTPLDKGRMTVTRAGWALERGSVFKLTSAKDELDELVVRVVSVDLGDGVSNLITVDLVEDVFNYADIVRPSGRPSNPPRLPIVVRPSVTAINQDVTAGVGTLTITVLDPEHRITEIAFRRLVGGSPIEAWDVVATGTPLDDLSGDYAYTVGLTSEAESAIAYRITYTMFDPPEDFTLENVFAFPMLPGPPAISLSYTMAGSVPTVVASVPPSVTSVKFASSYGAVPTDADVRAATPDTTAPFSQTFPEVPDGTILQVAAFAYTATGAESVKAIIPIQNGTIGTAVQGEEMRVTRLGATAVYQPLPNEMNVTRVGATAVYEPLPNEMNVTRIGVTVVFDP